MKEGGTFSTFRGKRSLVDYISKKALPLYKSFGIFSEISFLEEQLEQLS